MLKNPAVWRWLALPPLVILVRDLRATLVSNYTKWQQRYAVSFSQYLRGDPSGRRYNSDIWWCFRFLNTWGALRRNAPQTIMIVRYEDLAMTTQAQISAIVTHLALPLSQASIATAIERAAKPAMAARADPERPPGEVNFSRAEPLSYYDAADRAFLGARTTRYLKYRFGYDYTRW